jgi:acyl carrier protein
MKADLNALTLLFREVFDRQDLVLSRETSAADVPEWDSLMHIQVIVAAEKKFGVRFSPGEIEKLRNVGEFLALIQSKSPGT